jgi:hypothetical protein
MSKVIALRHRWQVVFVVCCGMLVFVATAQAETKTWNLASEFSLIKKNPTPDKYGHKSVWYYAHGPADSAVKYSKMKYFRGPAEEQAGCGIEEVYAWNRLNSVSATPAIWYNAGPTVHEGQDRCAGDVTLPSKTAFMHPEATYAETSDDAVVCWKSPIKGTVTVTGSAQLVDSFPTKGISWEFDKGATVLAGPGESLGTGLISFGPMEISVKKGEHLNLEIGRAMGVNGSYDSTAVTLNIESP